MRKSSFVTAGPVIATCLLGCLAIAAMAGDWPQFLGPNRNNVSPEQNLASKFPASGPAVMWTAKLGAGYNSGGDRRVRRVTIRDQETLKCLDIRAAPAGK